MLSAIDILYDCWIGPPTPERWPLSIRDLPPELAHARYAFREGLRLGLLLAAECGADDLSWP